MNFRGAVGVDIRGDGRGQIGEIGQQAVVVDEPDAPDRAAFPDEDAFDRRRVAVGRTGYDELAKSAS